MMLNPSSFCTETEKKQKRKRNMCLNLTNYCANIWSNHLVQHDWTRKWRDVGQNVGTTFGQLLVFCVWGAGAENNFDSAFSITRYVLSNPTKMLEHYCEHNCTN